MLSADGPTVNLTLVTPGDRSPRRFTGETCGRADAGARRTRRRTCRGTRPTVSLGFTAGPLSGVTDVSSRKVFRSGTPGRSPRDPGADPHRVPDRRHTPRDLREVEAETVAYIVAMRNGLRPRSEDYLASYCGALGDFDLHAVTRAANAVETLMGLSAQALWNQKGRQGGLDV